MVGDCAVGRTRPVTADALRNFPLPRTLTQRAGSLGLSAGAKDHGGAGGGGGGCGTDDAGWFCSELVSSWSTTLINCATIVTVVSATRYKTPRSSEVRTPPVRCGGERGMGTRFTPPAIKGHTQVDIYFTTTSFHETHCPPTVLGLLLRGSVAFHSHLCSIHTYKSNWMPALWVSVLAEFIGTFLFQLLGGSARTGLHNGVVLTVLIYMTGREAHSTLSCPFPHSPDTLTVRSRGEWRCAQSCRGHGTSGRRRDGSPQVGVLRRG